MGGLVTPFLPVRISLQLLSNSGPKNEAQQPNLGQGAGERVFKLPNSRLAMISCVITNLNGERWLPGLLRSIDIALAGIKSEEVEIILVDDGSTDSSCAIFAAHASNRFTWRLIRNPQNLGWSASVNRGIASARGDPVLVLSNDLTVDPDSICNMIAAVRHDLRIGVAQFNSLSLHDPTRQDSGLNFLDRFGYAYSRLPGALVEDVSFAEGVAFAVTRRAIAHAGLLDDSYFMEYDDMDFSWRILLSGFRVVFVPDAKIFHARGGTVGQTYFTRKLRNIEYYTRNHVVTIYKNFTARNFFIAITGVIVIESIKSAFFWITRRSGIANANMRGLMEGLASIPSSSSRRKAIQLHRQTTDTEILEAMHPFRPLDLVAFMRYQRVNARYIMGGRR